MNKLNAFAFFILIGFFSPISRVLAQVNPDSDIPIFTVVEQMPEYPGGEDARMKFLMDNINYPQEAKEKGIQGLVYVSFVIKETGEIINIKILRGIGGGCDEEVIRLVSLMPNWKPGYQAGKPVRVQFTMPCKFTLDNSPGVDENTQGFGIISMYCILAITSIDYETTLRPDTKPELRFSGFPNLEFNRNWKITNNLTFYTGISSNNIGIAIKDSVVTKFRYLGLGIPFGINFKLGKTPWGGKIGGGVIFPYHFKVKHYYNSDKTKDSEYFSKQVKPVHSYLQLSFGSSFLQFRVRYFLNEFFNENFKKEVNGMIVYPYEKTFARPIEFGLVIGM